MNTCIYYQACMKAPENHATKIKFQINLTFVKNFAFP